MTSCSTHSCSNCSGKAGVTVEELHTLICHRLASGTVRARAFERRSSQCRRKWRAQAFLPAPLKPFLGLDVHDVGRYFPMVKHVNCCPVRCLRLNQGFTYSPTIRSVPSGAASASASKTTSLITTTGHEVLTADLPKRPDEVLKLASTGVNPAGLSFHFLQLEMFMHRQTRSALASDFKRPGRIQRCLRFYARGISTTSAFEHGPTGQWELVRNDGGIEVYRRTVGNSPLHEVQGTGMIEAPVTAVLSVLDDVDHRLEWMKPSPRH